MPSVLLAQANALHLPLKDQSVHMICTSPPYWSLRDYGTATWHGGDQDCTHPVRTAGTRSKQQASSTLQGGKKTIGHQQEGYHQHCIRCGAVREDQQLGLEASLDEYVANLVQVFREVYRVLRNDGTLWLNIGDSYNAAGRHGHGARIGYKQGTNRASANGHDTHRPNATTLKPKDLCMVPARLALALQADGWYLRSEIIWYKPSAMPESVLDRPTKAHEQVFLLSKAPTYFFDAVAVQEVCSTNTHMRSYAVEGQKSHSRTTERGVKDTQAFHGYQPATRNLRTVWSVLSEPFSGAHFACFPRALAERCIKAGTSQHGVCSACGAPWQRIVSRQRLLDGHIPVSGAFSRPDEPFRIPPNGVGHYRYSTVSTDQGWQATCTCNAPVGPAVVLDPFAGSGTTGIAARALARHAVLLDLSWPYLKDIARARLGLSALARWEGSTGSVPSATYDDLPLFGATP